MFFKNNNTITLGEEVDIIKTIPKGVWLLMADEGQINFRLEKQTDLKLPLKLYGDETEIYSRILYAYKNSKNSIGALLSGTKGAGKTVTAKRICIESKLPTILITQAFQGDSFLDFISKINQEVVFLLDEFEKTYNTHEKQSQFLPILDGAFNSKKLWLFTTNSEEINEFLINRPSRVRYHIKFDKISAATQEEIIEDLLDNPDEMQGLLDLLDVLGRVSVDVLLNIIQEMNLYNEKAQDVIKYLNVKIEDTNFNVLAFHKGVRMTATIRYNPLTVNYLYIDLVDEDGKATWYSKEKEDFAIEISGEEFIFQDSSGTKLIFTRYSPYKFEL